MRQLNAFSLLAIFLCGSQTNAFAAINVSYVTLDQAAGYDSKRVYAGRVIASRASALGFKHAGRVQHVLVDIGGTVEVGQPLAHLDAADLAAQLRSAKASISLAQANLGAMQAEVSLARNTEARFRRLRESGHTPKQTYDEAYLNLRVTQSRLHVAQAELEGAQAAYDAAQIALDDATISAPFAGTIQARYVDEGSQVNPGQALLRIVENNKREMHVGVPGKVGARLEQNKPYNVLWNGETYPAIFSTVLPEVDPATRTQTAVFHLNDASIPLGSTVELVFNETVREDGYWLPLSALTQGERGLWGVYVIGVDNTVNRRLVELIHTETNRVFARGTLKQGDKVIDTGVHRVVPGQEVLPTNASATFSPDHRMVSDAR